MMIPLCKMCVHTEKSALACEEDSSLTLLISHQVTEGH